MLNILTYTFLLTVFLVSVEMIFLWFEPFYLICGKRLFKPEDAFFLQRKYEDQTIAYGIILIISGLFLSFKYNFESIYHLFVSNDILTTLFACTTCTLYSCILFFIISLVVKLLGMFNRYMYKKDDLY